MTKNKSKRISPSMVFLLIAVLVLGVAVAGYAFLGSPQLPAGGGVSQEDSGSAETQAPLSTLPPDSQVPESGAPSSSGGIQIPDDVRWSEIRGRPLDNVENLLQNPELPTGCEATAATILLRAYGYDVDKELVARALPKGQFTTYEGRRYGPHPDEAFLGNPFSNAGYGVFAAPIRQAMEAVVARAGGRHTVTDLTGAAQGDILACIDRGTPVCIWATMSLVPVAYRTSWYIQRIDGTYTDEEFTWPDNEHCMVLIGYTDTTVTVLDPRKGKTSYDRSRFFQRHEDVGGFALILE